MAKRVFESDLSVEGIKNLKMQLQSYKEDVLNKKCKELVSNLIDKGYEVAKSSISQSPVGRQVYLNIESREWRTGVEMLLVATGSIHEVPGREPFNVMLAVEFGSGIYYNQSVNPNADKYGYGPGTYPGQVHAFEDGWYYWDERSGKWRFTHGIKATMPMYNASVKIREEFESEIRRVFS